MDGKSIGLMDNKWLRRKLSLVGQEPTLFARSVRRNIVVRKRNAIRALFFLTFFDSLTHSTGSKGILRMESPLSGMWPRPPPQRTLMTLSQPYLKVTMRKWEREE